MPKDSVIVKKCPPGSHVLAYLQRALTHARSTMGNDDNDRHDKVLRETLRSYRDEVGSDQEAIKEALDIVAPHTMLGPIRKFGYME